MRITFILLLLLTAVARPAWSQDAQAQSTLPALPALPASLAPSAASAWSDPPSLDLRRDHARGALLGAQAGAVAGALVAFLFVCTEPYSEGNGDLICKAGGIGLGAIVGAIAGGIIGAPAGGSER